MIDLHCHILPGIDDGAQDLADAVGMARQAEADGITAICATPHIRSDHDVRIDELPARRDELNAAVAAAGCQTRVLPGGEVAVSALEGLDAEALKHVSLGAGGTWILLEPAPGPLDDSLDGGVAWLAERGMRVLIAHPERHLTPEALPRLKRLVDAGALVQATAASVVARRSRDAMLRLGAAGMIHVLGSDSHSSRAGRPVELSSALEALHGLDRLAPHREWIARTAPEAIVHGEGLTAPF